MKGVTVKMYIIWIIVLVAGILAEAATFTLISVWFALGALAALIAAAVGADMAVQIAVFLAVSVITLAFTRPVVRRIMPKKYTPTNGELDIGKSALVIERIDPAAGTGRVRIDGVDWGARSSDGSVIDEGKTVIIKEKGAAYVTVGLTKTI